MQKSLHRQGFSFRQLNKMSKTMPFKDCCYATIVKDLLTHNSNVECDVDDDDVSQ